MKSSSKLIPIIAFTIALGTISAVSSGCAGTTTQESTGEYIDDAALTTKVKAAFIKDEVVKALQVNVETFKGVVQLSGFVNSEAEKTRAASVARSIQGVTDVKNSIQVK